MFHYVYLTDEETSWVCMDRRSNISLKYSCKYIAHQGSIVNFITAPLIFGDGKLLVTRFHFHIAVAQFVCEKLVLENTTT